MKKNIDFILGAPIAHRGLHGKNVPENSLKAFKLARDAGYTIELDVHLSRDGDIIVFHDDNLLRMTGVNRSIKNCTYAELQSLTLKGTSYKIPTLKQVLDLVDTRVPLLIELKSDVKTGLLEKESMKVLRSYNGKFAVQSFSPNSIYYFKKHYPEVLRGQLSHSYNKSKIPFANNFLPSHHKRRRL